MKATSIFAAAVAALAGSVLEAGHYDKYQDWQWMPVEVADTNAANNVRFQEDDSNPFHGPWLTLPSETGMTITWITTVRCAGGIEYREKGTTNEWQSVWQVRTGQVDYSKDIHFIHLTGLKPATEYEYRILSNRDRHATAYHSVVNRGRVTYSFRTIDPKRDHYKVFLTCDLHGTSRLCLDPMIDRSGAGDSDFFFLLGDNVEDRVGDSIRDYITRGYLDDITRKWGTSKATIFLRGNHDIWGRDTYIYGDYFPQPDGKTYYAFRQGPVLFIGLDTLWRASEKIQNEQMEAYLKEQADWVRELKKTQMWKGATFRVVLSHVAPFPPGGHDWVANAFNDVFLDESKDGRIHAFVSGHEHVYARLNPNSNELHINTAVAKVNPEKYPPKSFSMRPLPERFPYVQIIGHVVEAMTIDVSPEKLVFKSHNYDFPNGGLFDAFELYPDGTIKDLVETTAFTIPPPAKSKK